MYQIQDLPLVMSLNLAAVHSCDILSVPTRSSSSLQNNLFDPRYFLKFRFRFLRKSRGPCQMPGPRATFRSQIPAPGAACVS